MSNGLKLNKEIYKKSMIEQTIKAYSGICDVQLSQESSYFICFFSKTVAECELTMKEFEDYLIGLMKKNEY